MNILILHPNFPGQFFYLAGYLGANPENRVVFLAKSLGANVKYPGVQVALYKPMREVSKETHGYLQPAEEAVLEGQAIVRALHSLKQQGFVPDVAIGHTGWGSMLYLKDFYPELPVIGYFEWYYHGRNSDAHWWSDETPEIDSLLRTRTKNAHHLLSLEACDVGYTPTQWQYQQFPQEFKYKLRVIHDGIDTGFCCPKENARLILKDIKLNLSGDKEILSYVSRGFEAYRGFPQFMDAVRILLKRRPKLHVVLVGADRVCYGAKTVDKTYQQTEEEKGGYDKKRVHFVGVRNRGDYRTVLQAADVHVYLTRPFVLSWSMLEAMSFGCPLVASATPPVEEVVRDGENGLLANFRSPRQIADQVECLLEDRQLAERLGKSARETILEGYEKEACLRAQANLMYSQIR